MQKRKKLPDQKEGCIMYRRNRMMRSWLRQQAGTILAFLRKRNAGCGSRRELFWRSCGKGELAYIKCLGMHLPMPCYNMKKLIPY
jgi:hypothetical protein